LGYVDANNLANDTIVIYTSDQGFFLGDHGLYDKRLMYEECLRMPFLIRYPAEIRAGSTTKDMALNIDFAPTFLDYAGQKPPADMQGHSLRAVLKGRTPGNWRKSMYYRYWMHNDSSHHVPALYGIRTHEHKLIYYYGKPLGMAGANEPSTPPEWEFFDLRADPREMRNRYSDPKYQGIIAKLKLELNRLQKEAGDSPVS
jgi:arylsulfatase A-like enzyme